MENAEMQQRRKQRKDPSDWPAPHQITDTFRQNMTDTGPLNCADGSYPRSEASNRRFSKAYCFRLLSNRERIEQDWFVIFQESFMKQVTIIQMLTFHGKNWQLACSYGRQLKWIARKKHLPNRSSPYNKICPHRWKEKTSVQESDVILKMWLSIFPCTFCKTNQYFCPNL